MGSVNIATIATSIAGYSISGVKIRDLDKMFESVSARHCPLLMPNPDNFVTNFRLSRESLGSDANAKKDAAFSLNYLFLHAPVGGSRDLAQVYDAMTANIILILNAFADDSSPSGAVDAVPVLGKIGVLQSPEGVDFFGCNIAINILTFYEVN